MLRESVKNVLVAGAQSGDRPVRALRAIARAILGERFLDEAHPAVEEASGYEAAIVVRGRAHESWEVWTASPGRGGDREARESGRAVSRFPPVARGAIHGAWNGTDPVVIESSALDPASSSDLALGAWMDRVEATSVLIAPLRTTAPVGVLILGRRGGDAPIGPDTIDLATLLAEHLAIGYEVAREREASRRIQTEQASGLDEARRELDTFAYSASHDLRAPLRAMDGFSKILIEDFGEQLGDEGKRLARIIRTNAARMTRLIDDLLLFSRVGRHTMSVMPIRMDAMVRDVVNGLRATAAGRTIDIEVGDLPIVTADFALMRQIWLNLVENAIKYTRTCDVARIQIMGAVDANEGVVRYTIADNGVGFDNRYAGKLFRAFQRLHSQSEYEGNGMGLALVERIVRRHGGTVTADGAVGQGAKFTLVLPAYAESAGA